MQRESLGGENPPQKDGTSLAGAALGAPPPLDVAAGLGLLPGCMVSLVCHPCWSSELLRTIFTCCLGTRVTERTQLDAWLPKEMDGRI